MTLVGEAAAAVYALLFLAAVLGKLDSWEQWSELSDGLPGPPAVGRGARYGVPAAESVVVALCVLWPLGGLAASALVLTGFAASVELLARQIPGRECNCFGAIAPATISPRLALRNVVLAVAAAAAWYVVWKQDVQALSALSVFLTVLLGAIALMVLQLWRLRQATRDASLSLREAE